MFQQLAGGILGQVRQELAAFGQQVGALLQQAQGAPVAAAPAPRNDTAQRKFGPGGVYQEPIGRAGFDRRRTKRTAKQYAAEAQAGDQEGTALAQGQALARMVAAGNADTSVAAQVVAQAQSVEEIAANLRAGVLQRPEPSQEQGLRQRIAQLEGMIAQQAALANPAPLPQHAPVQAPVQPYQAPQPAFTAPQYVPPAPPGWAATRYPMAPFVVPQQPWGGFPRR